MPLARSPFRFPWRRPRQRHPRIASPAGLRIDDGAGRRGDAVRLPTRDPLADLLGLGAPKYRKSDAPR